MKIAYIKNSKQHRMEYFYVLSTTPGPGTYHGVWLIEQATLHWGKLVISLFLQVSVSNNFYVRGRTWCLLPFLYAGILSGLKCVGFMHAVSFCICMFQTSISDVLSLESLIQNQRDKNIACFICEYYILNFV